MEFDTGRECKMRIFLMLSIAFGAFIITGIGSGYAQTSWCDDFESYASSSDWSPTWHGSGHVEGIMVDNSTAATGSQSLKMFGEIGGCWAAVATHPFDISLPMVFSFWAKNGTEYISGCHAYRASFGIRIGPNWPDCPCYQLVKFMPNGDLLLPSADDGQTEFPGFPLGEWHKIKCQLTLPGDGFLHVEVWANSLYLREFTLPEEDWFSEGPAYIDLAGEEGSAWFDDICYYYATLSEASIQPDTLFSIQAYAYPALDIDIIIGNFGGGFDATNVNLASLVVNDLISPLSCNVLSSYPGFDGNVISLSLNGTDFINSYPVWWNWGTELFNVSGFLNNGNLLTADAGFVSRGHTRGDVNEDGILNLLDIIYLLNNIYNEGPDPIPIPDIGDLNKDAEINMMDVLILIQRIYIIKD